MTSINDNGTQLKRRFISNRPRMRVMIPQKKFRFTVPEPDQMFDDDDFSDLSGVSSPEACASPPFIEITHSSLTVQGTSCPQSDPFEENSSGLDHYTHRDGYSPSLDDSSDTHHQTHDCEHESYKLYETYSSKIGFSPESFSSGLFSPIYNNPTLPLSKNKDQCCYCSPERSASYFDCKFCSRIAREPVLTSCGNLYCWPCLYTTQRECLVCESKVHHVCFIDH